MEDFFLKADHWAKLKESEKKDKYQDIAVTWKIMEEEIDSDTNFN